MPSNNPILKRNWKERSPHHSLQSRTQDLTVLETTLVSLQALELAYGADSQVVVSARQALVNMLKHAISTLDTKYDGDCTYQVGSCCPAL